MNLNKEYDFASIELSAALEFMVRPRVKATIERIEKGGNKASFCAAYLAIRLAEEGGKAADVARQGGVSRQFVYMALRGDRPLPFNILKAAHDAFPAISYAELMASKLLDNYVGVKHAKK